MRRGRYQVNSISFAEVPSTRIRDLLKSHGFRWNRWCLRWEAPQSVRSAAVIDCVRAGVTDPGEVAVVLDALDSGDDPQDCLDEWRHWRSPAGRRQEAYELFESGHPMGDYASLD